jgi:CheY-like chemotaxis protein
MPDQNMKTCLVVDDSKVVRMVARKILEELGFEVAEAEDGQVALDMSMESMPDVVLLDWNMPVMSDIEYLRALRVTDEGKNRSSCSARPRMIYRIFRKASLRAPTNTS